MTADDERLKLHQSQRFAKGRPADLHSFRQFALGWESVAWFQFSLPQIRGELDHHVFMQRPSLYFSQSVRHCIHHSEANLFWPAAQNLNWSRSQTNAPLIP